MEELEAAGGAGVAPSPEALAQLDQAREALSAAQAGANEAEARARTAEAELEAVRARALELEGLAKGASQEKDLLTKRCGHICCTHMRTLAM